MASFSTPPSLIVLVRVEICAVNFAKQVGPVCELGFEPADGRCVPLVRLGSRHELGLQVGEPILGRAEGPAELVDHCPHPAETCGGDLDRLDDRRHLVGHSSSRSRRTSAQASAASVGAGSYGSTDSYGSSTGASRASTGSTGSTGSGAVVVVRRDLLVLRDLVLVHRRGLVCGRLLYLEHGGAFEQGVENRSGDDDERHLPDSTRRLGKQLLVRIRDREHAARPVEADTDRARIERPRRTCPAQRAETGGGPADSAGKPAKTNQEPWATPQPSPPPPGEGARGGTLSVPPGGLSLAASRRRRRSRRPPRGGGERRLRSGGRARG